MDAVGIVPNDGKVRGGGLQVGKPPDGLIGENDAVGIGELGDDPDHFHQRILHIFLHHIHIRAGGGHGDVDQFGAIEFANLEVTVIAGGGAEELDLFLPAPGPGAVKQTVGIGTGDDIAHHIQRGCAADKHILRLAGQNICPVAPGSGQTHQLAVVPGVNVAVKAILGLLQDGENVADQIQLGLGGLAPGHIQIQLLLLAVGVVGQNALVFLFKLFSGHAGIRCHIHHPFVILLGILGLLYLLIKKNARCN